MDHVPHCFMPGQTIEAVLRLKGRHNLTRPEIDALMTRFNELNGQVVVRPGMTLKIPLPPPAGAIDDEGAID